MAGKAFVIYVFELLRQLTIGHMSDTVITGSAYSLMHWLHCSSKLKAIAQQPEETLKVTGIQEGLVDLLKMRMHMKGLPPVLIQQYREVLSFRKIDGMGLKVSFTTKEMHIKSAFKTILEKTQQCRNKRCKGPTTWPHIVHKTMYFYKIAADIVLLVQVKRASASTLASFGGSEAPQAGTGRIQLCKKAKYLRWKW